METRSNSYEKYRDKQMEDSRLFQDFVSDVFYANGLPITTYSSKVYQLQVGESRGGYEIKHDKRFQETGNLYIELAEKARPREGDYWPAGIYANDNSVFFITGDYDRIYLFAKNILILLHKSGRFKIIPHNGTKTSTGFLLPKADADKYAIIIFEPKLDNVIRANAQQIEREACDLYRKLAPQAADFTLSLPFE